MEALGRSRDRLDRIADDGPTWRPEKHIWRRNLQGWRPKQHGGRPRISHLAPKITHLAPQMTHLAPKKAHLAPRIAQLAPKIQYLAPKITHLVAPNSVFGAQNSSLGAQNSAFGAQNRSRTTDLFLTKTECKECLTRYLKLTRLAPKTAHVAPKLTQLAPKIGPGRRLFLPQGRIQGVPRALPAASVRHAQPALPRQAVVAGRDLHGRRVLRAGFFGSCVRE